MRYTFEQLKELLRSVGFPESVLDVMAAIGMAESSGNPNVSRDCPGTGYCTVVRNGMVQTVRAVPGQSPESSYGLYQINRRAHPQYAASSLYDPITNAKAAYDVFKKQGLRAWGSYTDGNYKSFMPGGAKFDESGAGPGVMAAPGGIVEQGVSGLVDKVKGWLYTPVKPSEVLFAPYLSQTSSMGQDRLKIAAIVAIIILVFAWNRL